MLVTCSNESGAILPQYRERGSTIQVMIGNTFDQQQQSKEAYPFYEAALSPALAAAVIALPASSIRCIHPVMY